MAERVRRHDGDLGFGALWPALPKILLLELAGVTVVTSGSVLYFQRFTSEFYGLISRASQLRRGVRRFMASAFSKMPLLEGSGVTVVT